MAVLRLRLEGEVRRVLVGCVASQSELDGTTVNARAQAVRTTEAIKPGDTAKEMALDGSGTLGSRIGFIEKDWSARATVVGHLHR